MKKYLIIFLVFCTSVNAAKYQIGIFNCKGTKDAQGHFFFPPSGIQIQIAKENNKTLINISPFLVTMRKLNSVELEGNHNFRGTKVYVKFNSKKYSGIFKIHDPGQKELTFEFSCDFLHMHPSEITLTELNKKEQSFLRK